MKFHYRFQIENIKIYLWVYNFAKLGVRITFIGNEIIHIVLGYHSQDY
jgi:hypothetical protein